MKFLRPIIGLIFLLGLGFGFETAPLALADSESIPVSLEVCADTDSDNVCDTSDSEVSSGAGESGVGAAAAVSETAAPPSASSGGTAPLDVFERLPFAPESVAQIEALTLGSFNFIQAGENISLQTPNVIRINGRKYLTIALPFNKTPPVLKTIGVTIFDRLDADQALSFVLQGDETEQNYVATLAPLNQAGIYPFNIHIINFHDQRIKKISGFLQVSGLGFVPGETFNAVFNRLIKPLVLTSGLLAGASQILAVSSVFSLYDVWLLILRGLGALFTSLGIRQRRKPWGTVYDAITKRPIDPAYVTVYQNGRAIANAITDIEGRYGFYLPAGTYELAAQKTHYQFPSHFLEGKENDELYGNLYFGGAVTTEEGEPVTLNIPLDPTSFDWNEFAKSSDSYFKRGLERELARARFYRIVSGAGFALALGSAALAPGLLNLSVLTIYFLLYLVGRSHLARHKLITVRQQITGTPIPFAVVRVFLAGLNKEVKTLVADRYGRVYILVRPGAYYLSLDRKLPDGSYYTFYRTPPRNLPNGLWSNDILVPQYKTE